MKWLVTAFEPFAQANSNSSLLVLNELKRRDWNGQVVFHSPVPVTFSGAYANLRPHLSSVDGVLALGQAEGRSRIGLERLALNLKASRIADNAGVQPQEEKIFDAGADLLWGRVPWHKVSQPDSCEISFHAGTFVCNTLFYELLARTTQMIGFVHLPLLKEQTGFPQGARLETARAVSAMTSILQDLVKL